jgi:hypothetical protein
MNHGQYIVDKTNELGGFTYPPVEDGYMVSEYPDCEEILYELTPYDVLEFMDKHKDLLKDPANYLGTWENEGKVYLDISKRYDRVIDALDAGSRHNQIAVYDVYAQKELFV